MDSKRVAAFSPTLAKQIAAFVRDEVRLGDRPGTPIEGREPVVRNVRRVKITGTEVGGGKYTGNLLWLDVDPATDIPATGNLTEAELGGVKVDDAGNPIVIRIVNSREVGKSTHDLAASGYLPLIVPAVFLKTASDGVPVYMVDVIQQEDCEEDEE